MTNISINDDIKYILKRLNSNGYLAYLVGGAVRDYLLGLTPLDFDITTSATPQQVKEVFTGNTIVDTGIVHGTVTLIMNHIPYQITTFRSEGAYLDNRHPQNVHYEKSLAEDLCRRDFTLNAICYHPEQGLVDYHNGIDDLNKKLIRAIGEPQTRFEEDALRVLRALRFASHYKFSIETKTAVAILQNKQLLAHLSKERIYKEFCGIILGKDVEKILNIYKDVFTFLFPSLLLQSNDQYKNMTHNIAISKPVLTTRLAIFLLKQTDYDLILTNYKVDNKTKKTVKILIAHYYDVFVLTPISIKHYLHDFTLEIFIQLLDMQKTSRLISTREYQMYVDFTDQIVNNHQCYQLKDLAVTGDDLVALNIPSKAIGPILNKTLQLVMDELLINDHDLIMEHYKKTLLG